MFCKKAAQKLTNSEKKDFDYFKDLLTTKYGKPTEVSDTWIDQCFSRVNYAERDIATSYGWRVLAAVWKGDETTICLTISDEPHVVGDLYKYQMKMTYSSSRLNSLRDAAFERDRLAGL